MNGQLTYTNRHRDWILFSLAWCLMAFASLSYAQVPVDEDGNEIAYSEQDQVSTAAEGTSSDPLSGTELQDLVGPIALYPDDLLAIVLPASTYPLEIVQAARFLELLESDSDLKPNEDWDESVVALLNYPDVIQLMNDDIDWTWRLGDAVISQQTDVIAAVEAFRDRAYAAGNLKSDERQTVTNDDGVIEIEPVSEEIIYVPYYEPREVVVYQPRPVYHYHSRPYPVYYYPYPSGYRFHSGYFWGVTTAFSIGWSNHYLNVYHPTYWGHPYYGRSYYSHYYRRPSISIYNNWYVNNSRYSSRNRHRDGDHWRPRWRAGSRQSEPRVRNYHYPPGSDRSRRQNAVTRSRLGSRDSNGRMDLNLRERREGDRARNRTTNNRRQAQLASSRQNNSRQNNRRAASSDRRNDGARSTSRSVNPQLGSSNRTRTSADGRQQTRTSAARTNRSPVAAQPNTRSSGSRPDIQFRERSNQNRSTNQRSGRRTESNTVTRRSPTFAAPNRRSSDSRTARPQATQNRAATRPRQSSSQRSNQRSNQRTNRQTTGQRPQVRAPQTRRSAPAVQQRSAPVRRSAPTPRSNAPRVTAPRQSSGSSRSSSSGRSSSQSSRSSSSSRQSTRGSSQRRRTGN